MTTFEYKVIPAPRRGLKGKGIKGSEARFAFAIQTLMNDHASEGWEFLRAETLASEERHGLASAQTVYRDLLVFRRPRTQAQALVNAAAPDYATPESAIPESAIPDGTEPVAEYADEDAIDEEADAVETDYVPDTGDDTAGDGAVVTPFESIRRD